MSATTRQQAAAAAGLLAAALLGACQSPPSSGDETLIDVSQQRELAARSTKAFSVAALPPSEKPPHSQAARPVDPDATSVLRQMEQLTSPIQQPQPVPAHKPPSNNDLLTLDVSNAPLAGVLQAIAQVAGVNLVLADGVKGLVSVQLNQVDWSSALSALLRANDLGMSRSGNVVWIAPRAQVLAERRQRLQAQLADMALVPLQTKAYQMNYAKATDVAAYLTGSKTRASVAKSQGNETPQANAPLAGDGQTHKSPSSGLTGVLSSRGSVMPEPRTNQLFVSDVPSSLARVAELIAHIDVPVRQVLIEARIVEADDSFSQELGVRLGGGIVPSVGVGGGRGVIGPNYDAVSGQLGGGVKPFVDLPSTGAGGRPAASFAVSLFSPDATRFINLELSALEADGRGVIVSRPSIVTADQVKALIEQGTEYPYQSTTTNGGSSVAFRRATLRLAVVPHITPHGQVMLQVDINKDSRGETTAQGVAINTKHVQTQVLVDNAGTAVIGGIFERYDRNVDTKVPLLGDIPGLGLLFSNRSSRSDKSEMLIFLTPHILQAPHAQGAGASVVNHAGSE